MAMLSSFSLGSPAFANLEPIPGRYTCEGQNTAPGLYWWGQPQATRSFALIVDDPDAPDPELPLRTFTHCVLFNLPAEMSELIEGFDPLPSGATYGMNDSNQTKFEGPCPPMGTHRYYFKLYALDDPLDLPAGASKTDVLEAMQGHVLATAELMGVYHKHAA